MPNKRTIPRVCETCSDAFFAWGSSFKPSAKPNIGRFCSRNCAALAKTAAAAKRFMSQAVVTGDASTCWPSPVGSPNASGHIRMRMNGGRVFAHKLAWVLAGGSEIGEGAQVLHTCDNPPCVRNDDVGVYILNGVEYERRGHLWLGDHNANMADKLAKGRCRGGRHRRDLRHAE